MIKFIFTAILIISHIQMNTAQSLSGEYRLTGVHDAASAFRFTKDGKFEFFFMYGAVDRAATGTYTIEGKTLRLKSDKVPGQDFPVTKQSKQGKNYTIQVSDPNTYLLSNVIAIYYIDGKENGAYSDNNGLITIPETHVDKIMLVHELFADTPTLIKDENNTNNHFEVTLSPTLVQVSFDGVEFAIQGNEISCPPNYTLPFQTVVFEKQ